MKRGYGVLALALLAVLIVWGATGDTSTCYPALVRYGVVLDTCPVGTPRQTGTLEVHDLRRGAQGTVVFRADAHYMTDWSMAAATTMIPDPSVALTLVDAANKTRPLAARGWHDEYGTRVASLTLPTDLPDGDYKLRATYSTHLGSGTVEVAVPLYAPARIHVITDRPLYEPGNTVKFRAVVVRARDLSPIDGRPGMWIVRDPSGETVLEEKAPAGAWGVVAGTFPLDKAAPTGTWTLAWASADAREEVPFTVEPFTLPRFRVDASAPHPFYRPGETPAIRGAVVYSSGAPVSKAVLTINWQATGDWPVPLDWQEKTLPKQVVVGANGRFELALPRVPEDLQGKVSLVANISALDAAGDRVATVVPVLLSADGIDVSTVTELADGLVEGFNNRMYVRVTTPDGRVVTNAKVHVKRAWQDDDPGVDATLDEDGVASLQLDPGPPVNVVIPARPYRPQPRPPLVSRGEVNELIGGEGASLADQVEMDRWLPAMTSCGKWVGQAGAADDGGSDESGGVEVAFRVTASGSIATAGGGASPLARCVVNIVRGRRLPAGGERLYTATFNFGDPDLPSLAATVESALDEPDGLSQRFDELAASTRDCLPANAEGSLPLALTWSVRAGEANVELGGWIRDPQGTPNAAQACVQSRVTGRVTLPEKATRDSLGLVRFSVAPPAHAADERPQPTTMLGYELLVSAEIDGKPSTKIRIAPGTVPSLRMRVTPTLAKPGDTVTAELIRGPSFSGELPKKLEMRNLKLEKPVEAKLDDDRRTTFKLDPKVEGWVEITGGGQRALVYVAPAASLAVRVTPGKDRYAPGQMAELGIKTEVDGKGGKAAVSLIGVDDSLSQLVPLPGPDAMSKLQPRVGTSSPAFGSLDGQALALGRIHGSNAAAATVLRVTEIPQPPQLDAVVNATAGSKFEPEEELTDRFYSILEELHRQVAAWESRAKKTEKMHPRTMVGLWNASLDAIAKRGGRVDDPYGRRLRLSLLPPDLLSLVDPHEVVIDGTRLPEDVENWLQWVTKEKP